MFETMTEELIQEVLDNHDDVEIFANGKLYTNMNGVIRVHEHDNPPDNRITLNDK